MKKNQITLFICLAANLVFAQQKHEINVGLTGVRYNMNFTPGVSIAYFYKVLPKYALGLRVGYMDTHLSGYVADKSRSYQLDVLCRIQARSLTYRLKWVSDVGVGVAKSEKIYLPNSDNLYFTCIDGVSPLEIAELAEHQRNGYTEPVHYNGIAWNNILQWYLIDRFALGFEIKMNGYRTYDKVIPTNKFTLASTMALQLGYRF